MIQGESSNSDHMGPNFPRNYQVPPTINKGFNKASSNPSSTSDKPHLELSQAPSEYCATQFYPNAYELSNHAYDNLEL